MTTQKAYEFLGSWCSLVHVLFEALQILESWKV